MNVLEVGAGTARNSDYLQQLVAERQQKRDPDFRAQDIDYTATDVAPITEKGRFLKDAAPGINTRGGMDANDLGSSFEGESLDAVVGANAFGNWKVPGQSYGLRRTTKSRQKAKEMTPDTRLLQSAHPVLKPGGKVRLFGRSNVFAQTGNRKSRVKTPNPFLDATPEELQQAAQVGYDVHVRHVKQDPNRKFERPDTEDRDTGRKDLGEFNTEYVFRKRKGPGGVKLHRHKMDPDEALHADSDEELEPGSLSTDRAPSRGGKKESKEEEEEEEDGV